MNKNISIIIPSKNEALSLSALLPKIKSHYPLAEIIVVNDGSNDDTIDICKNSNVICITHPHSLGNGAAIKRGTRIAKGDILVFMDADGQHNPNEISVLLSKLNDGYDMVIGARNRDSQANHARYIVNTIYNRMASWMVGQKVADLTSGFRAVRAKRFKRFLYLLPNGFSYPTTITMSFFRAGFVVGYVPIIANKRIGKSHIKLFRDGTKFLLIIFKIGTLYSPLKLFLPISLFFFFSGIGYYIYTFLEMGRFTNMSALMLSTSVLVFLIGLVSEQITSMIFSRSN